MAGGEGLIQKGLLALAAFLPRLVQRLRVPGEVIDVPTLKTRLAGEAAPLLLDVRDAEEYAAAHIQGAHHLPLSELSARLEELAPWRDRPVTVICRTDRRSAEAVRRLDGAGFAQPILVKGGMQRWEQEGFAVEGAAPASEVVG